MPDETSCFDREAAHAASTPIESIADLLATALMRLRTKNAESHHERTLRDPESAAEFAQLAMRGTQSVNTTPNVAYGAHGAHDD